MSRFSLNKFPERPGVYAVYAQQQALWVGATANLRQLAEERLFGGEDPGDELLNAIGDMARVTEISWWQHPALEDEGRRNAACAVAIEVLSPVTRPRYSMSRVGAAALEDPEFVKSMEQLFHGPPAGSFVPQTLDALARNVYELKEKVAELERRLAGKD